MSSAPEESTPANKRVRIESAVTSTNVAARSEPASRPTESPSRAKGPYQAVRESFLRSSVELLSNLPQDKSEHLARMFANKLKAFHEKEDTLKKFSTSDFCPKPVKLKPFLRASPELMGSDEFKELKDKELAAQKNYATEMTAIMKSTAELEFKKVQKDLVDFVVDFTLKMTKYVSLVEYDSSGVELSDKDMHQIAYTALFMATDPYRLKNLSATFPNARDHPIVFGTDRKAEMGRLFKMDTFGLITENGSVVMTLEDSDDAGGDSTNTANESRTTKNNIRRRITELLISIPTRALGNFYKFNTDKSNMEKIASIFEQDAIINAANQVVIHLEGDTDMEEDSNSGQVSELTTQQSIESFMSRMEKKYTQKLNAEIAELRKNSPGGANNRSNSSASEKKKTKKTPKKKRSGGKGPNADHAGGPNSDNAERKKKRTPKKAKNGSKK